MNIDRKEDEPAPKPVFKSVPLRFDRRNSSFNIHALHCGKWLDLNLTIPEYYLKYLSWKYQTAEVFVKNNNMFVNVCLARDIEPVKVNTVVGVDLGINNLAVCSNGAFYKTPKTKNRLTNHFKIIRTTNCPTLYQILKQQGSDYELQFALSIPKKIV